MTNKFEADFAETPVDMLPNAHTKTRAIMEQGAIDGKSTEEIYAEVMEWAEYYASRTQEIVSQVDAFTGCEMPIPSPEEFTKELVTTERRWLQDATSKGPEQ